jgi:hypothetical protein
LMDGHDTWENQVVHRRCIESIEDLIDIRR